MKKRLIPIFILIAYSAVLIKVMVFKDVPVIRIGSLMINFGGVHDGPANLLPFKTILPYLLGEQGLMIAAINLVGNVVLLVPIGLLVPVIYRNMTWKRSLALGAAAGLTIEGMQAVLHVGIFDVDDVMLNGLGVMVGYWLFVLFAKMVFSIGPKKMIITAFVIMVVIVGAAFYAVAVYQKSRPQVSFEPGAENGEPDRSDHKEGEVPQNLDPCRGTGGTGQIVSLGNNTITIRLHDGASKIINLTDHTIIRTSAGAASRSVLKTGAGVTVVLKLNHDGSDIATIVLICNTPGAGPVK